MSLINEALKKARDKNALSASPQQLPASARVVSSPPSKAVGVGMWIFATVAVSGLAALLWYFLSLPEPDRWTEKNIAADQPFQPTLAAPQQVVSPRQPLPPVAPPPPSGAGAPRNVSVVTPPPAIEPPQQTVAPAQPLPPLVAPPQLAPPVAVQQPSAPRLPRPDLKVQATMVFPDSRAVIINGYEYVEGEEVEGATVVEIKLNGVRLRFNGEEYFLKIR